MAYMQKTMVSFRYSLIALPLSAVGVSAALTTTASAQASTSRPVVQALPSSEVRDLKEVLRILARRPRDVDALLDAGYASLKVQDFEAAMGFFGRAEEVSPENPRVKMGMASVFLRSGKPIQALQLFSEAEATGASAKDVLSDRGLAYDLVGDQLRAQAHYREALRQTPSDNETVRRMAVSQAIAGNEGAFRETLQPLVDKRDFAAFRAQAFGLAILGEEKRAADVTEAVMPSDLAKRIVPYLAYMPRLTKSQQAAAANLGIFPLPAEIGRDDPRIAQYAGGSPVAVASTELARTADNRLEPAGEPLGSTRVIPVEPAVKVAEKPKTEQPAVGPGFDLANAGVSTTTTSQPTQRVRVTRVPPPPSPAPRTAPKSAQASFVDAFADLGNADTRNVEKVSDAVDIESIIVPRESEAKPEPVKAEPKGPEHPKRYWVQLGTAQNASGLKFDWRRLSRQQPELLGDLDGYTVPFGEQHRLLAGPVESEAKRNELVSALTEKGLGVLPYTSPEGTQIQELE